MYDSKASNESYLSKYVANDKAPQGILSSGHGEKDTTKEDAGGAGAKKADPKYGMGD